METQQPTKTRTASQRLDDLERGVMAMYQAADNIARDVMTLKEAIKLLGNKLDAVVKATSAGEALTDETLSRIMVQNNVDELKEKVTNLVGQGILVATDTVTEATFIVGREVDDKGAVVNPRMQFVVSALQAPLKAKLNGAKIGQLVEFQEGKLKFEVLEAYSIQSPKAPEAAQPEAQTLEAALAPEAKAAEQSSSDANTTQASQSSDSSGS